MYCRGCRKYLPLINISSNKTKEYDRETKQFFNYSPTVRIPSPTQIKHVTKLLHLECIYEIQMLVIYVGSGHLNALFEFRFLRVEVKLLQRI